MNHVDQHMPCHGRRIHHSETTPLTHTPCLFMIRRLGLYPIVCPAHVTQGLSAKDWCDACIAVAVEAGGSGKGGGRPEQANATVVIPSGMDVGSILEAAKIFAASKLHL
jgi:hypothetical protein